MLSNDDGRHLFIPLANQTVEVLEAQRPPLECIAAVASMARWVDDVLEEFVVDARHEGADWSEIAAALGVTKQAAWQRFRNSVPDRPSSEQGYLTSDAIWDCLVRYPVRGRWYSLDEIYGIVREECTITEADERPDAPGSSSPRWQRNVRNVLQRRKHVGDVEWDGHGSYCIPPPL